MPPRNAADNSRLTKTDDIETTPRAPAHAEHRPLQISEKREPEPSAGPSRPLPASILSFNETALHGGVVDQAWVTKMASEIARRMQEDKMSANQCSSFWDRRNFEEAPPAYGQ